MGDGNDDRIVGTRVRVPNRCDAVFALRFGTIDPRVINVGLDVVFLEFVNDVDDLGIAQIGAVFLEGEPEHKYAGAVYLNAALGHSLDQLRYDIDAHVVVEPAPSENDLGVIAHGLGFVGEVVGVDTYAVSAHEPGPEGQEIPFCAGSLQNGLGIDTHFIEDERQFVNQGNVDVALGILDDLGGFRDLDAGGLVGADSDDLVVKCID